MRLTSQRKLAGYKRTILRILNLESANLVEFQSRVKKIGKGQDLPDDYFGFRIICKNKQECYRTARILHKSLKVWKLKDYYINYHPQEPTYRSIHLLVKINKESHIEIQIKTIRAHNRHMLKRRLLGDHYWRSLTPAEIVQFDKTLRINRPIRFTRNGVRYFSPTFSQ